METNIKLVVALIYLVVIGEASKSLEDTVNEMRLEMVENKVKMVHLQERLALTEAKLTMNNKDVRLYDLQ